MTVWPFRKRKAVASIIFSKVSVSREPAWRSDSKPGTSRDTVADTWFEHARAEGVSHWPPGRLDAIAFAPQCL
jgi:hypothetical protein